MPPHHNLSQIRPLALCATDALRPPLVTQTHKDTTACKHVWFVFFCARSAPMRSFFRIAIGLVCSLVHATPFTTLTCSSFDNVAGAIQTPHQAASVASRHWNELDDVQGSRQAWTTAVGRPPAVRWRFHFCPSVLDSPRIRTRFWPGLAWLTPDTPTGLPDASRCWFLCLATHGRTLDRSHTAST